MEFHLYVFILAACTVHDSLAKKPSLEELIENRMMGVDAVHASKINMKERNANHQPKPQEERQPDWSYNTIPEDLSGYVEEFKQNMTECLKEVQANDKRPVQRLSPSKESPVHGECLVACVLKRNGVIENGKVNKANLLALVSKFYAKDTKLMKKLEKNLDRCVEMSVRTRDDCELAGRLNICTNALLSVSKHKITINY